jgi:protocatechuate 3,4-dioxygenase beta subunit
MKRTPLVLAGLLLTTTALTAQQSAQQMFDAAQKLKPARLTSIERIAPASEGGTPFVVKGVVLDSSGKPVAAAEVFAYHTDRTGLYAAPGAADPWRLKGWAMTDAQGRFELRTIRPGPYPNANIPAHVHVHVTASCCGRQEREMVFDDDALVNTAFRDQHGPESMFLYSRPIARADGSQEVSYTIRLR